MNEIRNEDDKKKIEQTAIDITWAINAQGHTEFIEKMLKLVYELGFLEGSIVERKNAIDQKQKEIAEEESL